MAKLMVVSLVLGELSTNCYIVGNTETREAIVIDPAAEPDYIIKSLNDSKLKCIGIFLTHGHIDHIGAMNKLKSETGAKTYASEDEVDILGNVQANLSAWLGNPMNVTVDETIKDGEQIEILGNTLTCISVPGHTKGGMCYYFADDDILFSGDTLFASSVGRSDFPTGDADALLTAIEEKLLVLPDETIVYPGHNNRTKISREKKLNPFFQ